MLYETLNKLPENYRTVFMKSFFEGKTHAEIAEEMNLSVKSINRYKQKTMELLRNELKDYLPLFLLFLSPEQLIKLSAKTRHSLRLIFPFPV